MFFDLRKAFDKVWHKGLLAKLSALGVSGVALQWFRSYLSGRCQRTVVGRTFSSSRSLFAGVPQGAILSTLLFIIYTNDIPRGPSFEVNQFADDTSVCVTSKSPEQLQARLHQAIQAVVARFDKWLLSVNSSKTVLMVFRSKGMKPVHLGPEESHGTSLQQVSTHKHLGLVFNETLSWSDHCHYVVSKMSKRIGLLFRLRRILTPLIIRELYRSCIRPLAEYSSFAWSGIGVSESNRLEKVQRRAARRISGVSPQSDTPRPILLSRAGLSELSARRSAQLALFCHRFLSRTLPSHFSDFISDLWLPTKSVHSSFLCSASSLCLPRPHKAALKQSPLYLSFSFWNSLSKDLQSSSFSALKAHFSSLQ